jgi:hypothetical protein
MKCMVAWKIPPGCYKAAVERFLNTGAPNPTGVKTLGRWHAPGSSSGWLFRDSTTILAGEVVVVGTGGLGKTQLAIEYAHRMAPYFSSQRVPPLLTCRTARIDSPSKTVSSLIRYGLRI